VPPSASPEPILRATKASSRMVRLHLHYRGVMMLSKIGRL
jgi:hypothetical protein